MRNLFSFIFLGLLLSGCKIQKLQDASGKYHGEMIKDGKITPIVFEFPYYKNKDIKNEVKLTLSSLSNLNDNYVLTLNFNKTGFSLTSTDLGVSQKIEVIESCNTNETSIATICLEENNINLSVKTSPRLALKLQKVPKIIFEGKQAGYSKEELMIMAKFSSYESQVEAIKVFQAFNNVKMMKGNLLPKINMGMVLEVAAEGYLGLIGSIGNLLPFIFPSNWYKVSEVKELYKAQKDSFASMRGNQMNLVEGLYYLTQRDYLVLDKFDQYLQWLKSIHKLLKQEEADLVIPKGTSILFERYISEMEKDRNLLNTGLQQELAVLAQSVGLQPLEGLKISRLEMNTIKPSNDKFEIQQLYSKALERSFEIKTIDSLIKAARLNVKDTGFSFLDPSSSEFLGFGYAAQMKVAKGEITSLELKKSELLSKIQEELVRLVSNQDEFLQSLPHYQNLKRSQQLKVEQIIQIHIMGGYEDSELEFILELIEESKALMEYDLAIMNLVFSQIVNKSKIDRIVLENAYKNLDVVTPFY